MSVEATLSDGSLFELGSAIPDIPHAVSVSLPSWEANVGYEEGEEWVLSKMKNGYPRFFIHLGIQAFAEALLHKYAQVGERALLFPSTPIATRCADFVLRQSSQLTSNGHDTQSGKAPPVRVLDLVLQRPDSSINPAVHAITMLSVVVVPNALYSIATKFWQHTGDGVSSRRAEFFHKAFNEGHLVLRQSIEMYTTDPKLVHKGPRRYQKGSCADVPKSTTTRLDDPRASTTGRKIEDSPDYLQFVEERFGRNLDLSLASNAKLAIRRRIAGSLTVDLELDQALTISDEAAPTRHDFGFTVNDIYLYPTGMSSIFNTHRSLLSIRGSMKSIMFGFPYIDTLKILEKFGPGAEFYGHGSSQDLDNIEHRCEKGERFLALFCEFPGNPLLKSPDLERIRKLADRYDFAVVIDETIGNFLNVHVLSIADVVVSSLTKVFSGDSNVMGGSCVLNPNGRYYKPLRDFLAEDYDDHYWPEDAIFMERNSRDFVTRNQRINTNAEAVCQILKSSPRIKEVYYPKFSSTNQNFELFRNATGGYGGLFSLTFHTREDAVTFFDKLETAKGPSLGTNFTLSSPFVILAHYGELEWAAKYGATADLVRISVGLEPTEELCAMFGRALQTIS